MRTRLYGTLRTEALPRQSDLARQRSTSGASTNAPLRVLGGTLELLKQPSDGTEPHRLAATRDKEACEGPHDGMTAAARRTLVAGVR
jgi:hypothetical protein